MSASHGLEGCVCSCAEGFARMLHVQEACGPLHRTRVAVGQMTATGDKQANFGICEGLCQASTILCQLLDAAETGVNVHRRQLIKAAACCSCQSASASLDAT